MKKYKAVIFDLDGVIISTDNQHYLAWLEVCTNRNIHFDKQINNLLRGVSRTESLEIILHNAKRVFNQVEKDDILTEKNNFYVDSLSTLSEKSLSEDVKYTLSKLKENNILIAIGSSSKNAKIILQNLNIIDLFDAVSDGNNITKSKPDPEVFLIAAQMLGLKPAECLVVEDAHAGIEAAYNGKMDSVGINDAYTSKLATYQIKRLSEILKIII
ncbi:MAG: beta-phosphoglucomutase [Acholeplasmataceae bacterium]|nr:beta-phosphoglucomutase [Acholeplasmataceae bacterium]